MKKITAILLAALMLLGLCSCGSGGKDEETTAALKTDWRNTIEYEGSFYVNSKMKVLYALDKGSITLWDNGGEGATLQTINYDTSVSDAIERIEKEDFNGDGNRDIRIIYSENEKGTRYSLFLWSEKTGRFAECKLYGEIVDPVVEDETGYVVGVFDNGSLGVVTTRYTFNENCGLDIVSVEFSNPQNVVRNITDAFISEGLTIYPAAGNATIDNLECTTYIASDGSKDVAYVSYTETAKWYIDKGCRGYYREVLSEEDALVLGKYTGEYNGCHSFAYTVTGEDCEIIDSVLGIINGETAYRYTLVTSKGDSVVLASDKRGYWYHSEDGTSFIQLNASTGTPVNDSVYEFALPETE